jgi:hypothetical protein
MTKKPGRLNVLKAGAAAASFLALALLSQGRALPGPPERATGKLMLVSDDVLEGLRNYRQEKDPKKRLAWLQTFGATGDPRVALALVDAANNQNGDDLDCEAADVLWWYYASPDAASHRGRANSDVVSPPPGKGFRPWWKANEADVHRRAARLPR